MSPAVFRPSRTKAAFPHLYRLHHLPFAYAATVVEVVRRKEFGQFMNDWVGRLRETLINFTAREMARLSSMMFLRTSKPVCTLTSAVTFIESSNAGTENGIWLITSSLTACRCLTGETWKVSLISGQLSAFSDRQHCWTGSNQSRTTQTSSRLLIKAILDPFASSKRTWRVREVLPRSGSREKTDFSGRPYQGMRLTLRFHQSVQLVRPQVHLADQQFQVLFVTPTGARLP
jgi:hypothetical protein